MLKKLFAAVTLTLALSYAVQAQNYSLWGKQGKKDTPIYKPGEKMEFTIMLYDGKTPVEGKKLKWTRTGDDGITQKGEGSSSKDGFKITTSMDKPGFVRIYVTASDDNNKPIMFKYRGKDKSVFFDGGACVAPETLKGMPEPSDFDKYWTEQKKLLASVPLKVLEMKEVKGTKDVVAYDVKISCAGKMPVSGYLCMPKNAAKKSLPAEVTFHGYGVGGANKKLKKAKDRIVFDINAHGILNAQPKEYYKNLGKTTLKGYAFSKKENSNPDTAYFHDMFLRVIRALEYVKSLPEWNGKDLKATGGSQGGLQSLAAAGLDKDVTECYAWSPWCCDMGRSQLKRLMGGWGIAYTPAILYFDPVNHVKRANPNCKLHIIANLGDYVCPASGVWIAYNNFPGPKTLEVRQGCEHGFYMPNCNKFFFKANQK